MVEYSITVLKDNFTLTKKSHTRY